jgi:hypothetical protein
MKGRFLKMSNETIIQFLLNLILVYVGAMTIIHERELIRFERKVKRCVKAFFKAVYLSIKEKRDKNV